MDLSHLQPPLQPVKMDGGKGGGGEKIIWCLSGSPGSPVPDKSHQ